MDHQESLPISKVIFLWCCQICFSEIDPVLLVWPSFVQDTGHELIFFIYFRSSWSSWNSSNDHFSEKKTFSNIDKIHFSIWFKYISFVTNQLTEVSTQILIKINLKKAIKFQKVFLRASWVPYQMSQLFDGVEYTKIEDSHYGPKIE